MFYNYIIPNKGYYPPVWMIPPQPFHPQNIIECKEEEEKNLNKIQQSLNNPKAKEESLQPIKEQSLKCINEEKKKKKRGKNLKKLSQNEEYIPEDELKTPKEKGKQNMLRNILPNIMHQTCTFVQKKSRSENFITRLLNKFRVSCGSVERYYLYQRLIRQKNNHYINEDALNEYNIIHEPKCEVFSLEEQQLYLHWSRMLIKHFLFNELRLYVLTSNRMKTETKSGHMTVLRRVINRLEIAYKQ